MILNLNNHIQKEQHQREEIGVKLFEGRASLENHNIMTASIEECQDSTTYPITIVGMLKTSWLIQIRLTSFNLVFTPGVHLVEHWISSSRRKSMGFINIMDLTRLGGYRKTIWRHQRVENERGGSSEPTEDCSRKAHMMQVECWWIRILARVMVLVMVLELVIGKVVSHL